MSEPIKPKSRWVNCLIGSLATAFVGALLFVLFALPLFLEASACAVASKGCLHASYICRGYNSYATEHHGNYPQGKSSTEIFQVLLDGHYVDDPGLFYLPMKGKVKATTPHLSPENVSWDVTYSDNSAPSDQMPFVFTTGYKVNYSPGASLSPSNPPPAWLSWWLPRPYMAVGKVNGGASVSHLSYDGTNPGFIPADFDPTGHVYRQLTPDGEVSP